MTLELLLAAGIASGTVLLFAALGEILTERAGILNLGVEGMMFVGALAGFRVGMESGNALLGLGAAMAAGGLLAALHAVVTVRLGADQTVSGLALTLLGTGVALVLGEGLAGGGGAPLLPTITVPVLSGIPFLGPVLFTGQSAIVYVALLLVPALWLWIERTRPGLHLRAVGENPTAADSLGVNVARTRIVYTIAGGTLAGLAGATITMAISPGWNSAQTTSGQGWIAVGLVIFARWSPLRALVGAWLIATIRRLTLDLQGPDEILGLPNVFHLYQPSTFFLEMLPYALVILVVVLGSRDAVRRRLGAPAALGVPWRRGERGR